MGRPKYIFTAEERQRLIDTYRKHGWKWGYYQNFGCSFQTCKRELIRLGMMG
jgi:hypothetical protein